MWIEIRFSFHLEWNEVLSDIKETASLNKNKLLLKIGILNKDVLFLLNLNKQNYKFLLTCVFHVMNLDFKKIPVFQKCRNKPNKCSTVQGRYDFITTF